MKVRELIDLLNQLEDEKDIYIAVVSTDSSGQIHVAPVCESCDDSTIIGYVITDEQNHRYERVN